MKTEEQVWQVIVDCNPVPDVNVYGREDLGGTAYLATLEQRSSEMTQVDTKPESKRDSQRPKVQWLVAAALALVAGVAVILISQGSDAEPAAEPTPTTTAESASPGELLLASYATAVGAGEIDEVMTHYVSSSSIIVKRHPYASNDHMDRSSAVRDTEILVPGFLGSGGSLEIFDMVPGDPDSVVQPDVTFSWRIYYSDVGNEPTGWFWTRDGGPEIVSDELNCIGGRDGKIYLEGNKIKEINWGFEDVTQCENQP